MDIEYITIQALFYDYPVELAAKAIREPKRHNYLEVIPRLSRWREDAFTMSEMRLLTQYIHDSWKHNQYVPNPNAFGPISYGLTFIPEVANEWIYLDHTNQPVVKFPEIFRWRRFSEILGEDVYLTAFLASEDKRNTQLKRDLFLWPDTLHHDFHALNEELEKGLSDVHAHFGATADVAQLNWMSLMNQIESQSDDLFKFYQENATIIPEVSKNYSIRNLTVAAAYIRLKLVEYFIYGNKLDKLNLKKALDILDCDTVCREELTKTQGRIDALREQSLQGVDGHSYDYAIYPQMNLTNHLDDVNILYHGERSLLYNFFLRLYESNIDAWKMSPYMYLYLLIKTRIRREFVQTNNRIGFENFQIYQDNKSKYTREKILTDKYPQIALQSSVRANTKDYLEGRIAPENLDTVDKDFKHSLYTYEEVIPSPENQLSFVVHFIKRDYRTKYKKEERAQLKDNVERYASYRESLRENIVDILEKRQTTKNSNVPQIVGIDAASTELFCRPEVFAHVFRYARYCGLNSLTYHAGEDFFDLMDGMRAIDEAVVFLDLKLGSRIGHALAIGENAHSYYESRHYNTIAPKQYLLDNYVWLYYRARKYNVTLSPVLEDYLVNSASTLYYEIGYDGGTSEQCFSMLDYWQSMLLRGDEPSALTGCEDSKEYQQKTWEATGLSENPEAQNAAKNPQAKALYGKYHLSQRVKENGNQIGYVHYPHEIRQDLVDVVSAIQAGMRRTIAKERIAIECNPTSNLKIGRFDKYEQHPIFVFRPIEADPKEPIINVSINTDDRGVFATSLYNEYSYIALAMQKKGYNEDTIVEYISHVRHNAEGQRFK